VSNLGIRVVVACVGIPVIVGISILGGPTFFVLICAISSVALLEFFRMSRAKGARPLVGLGLLAGLALTATFFHNKLQTFLFAIADQPFAFPTQPQLFVIVALCSIAVVSLAELFRNDGSAILNLGTTIFGVFYISVLLATLVGVREVFLPLDFPMHAYFGGEESFFDQHLVATVYTWGGYTVVSLFACIWLCDTAAYFAGRAVGKHKLFPRVSPNKTWEGALAGFLVAVAAGLVAKFLVLEYLTIAQAAIFGAIAGTFGQAGDLVESLLKRDAGAKDSSSIIPGHGGVFDRFDSLILASPIVYLYLEFIVFSR
jgi:phosphatidate cytidylyltransferase